MSLRNISNFFNIIKKGRLRTKLDNNDMIPVGTRDITNKSVYQDAAISFKDLKSQIGGGGGGGVTSVSGAAPIASTGGTTPLISMPAASSTLDGYLKSTEFASFTAKQDALTFNPPSSNNANPSTSAEIKTALDAKQATITGAATTIDDTNLTASRAVVSDGSGKVAVSAVTSTEIGYLDGVSSAIQTQLNSKQATITGAATSIDEINLTTFRTLISDGSGKVAVSPVTSTELGYLDGVSSLIQTQLNAKQGSLTLTTTGSGAATLVGNTLNIPTSGGGSSFWTANGSSIYNSNAGSVSIGTTNTQSKLTIQGNGSSGMTSAFQLQQGGTATPWLIANDAGQLTLVANGTAEAKLTTAKFRLTTSPTAGHVLTADASGNATWELPTGMNTATATLSSGSINMGSSVNILSAPAATQYYVIHSVVMKFKGGSVAFNNSTVYGFNMERGVIDTSVAAAAGPATSVDIPTNTTDIILAWISGATAPGQAFTCSKVGGTTPSAGDSNVVFDVTYELKDF